MRLDGKVCRAARTSLRCTVFGVALTWLVSLFSAPALADAAADLAKNRSVWRSAGVADYEYGYHKYCACHPDTPPETIVTVRAGSVVRVRHRPVGYDREVEAPRGLEYYWTIDGLFDLIAAALDKHAQVSAAYDPTLGYPTEIHVDYDANLIGDEVDLMVTRLDRLAP
jgi:hypothetical protein